MVSFYYVVLMFVLMNKEALTYHMSWHPQADETLSFLNGFSESLLKPTRRWSSDSLEVIKC